MSKGGYASYVGVLLIALSGLVSLSTANPNGYATGQFSNVTLVDNSTIAIFVDLQTFPAAQATCQTWNGTVEGVLTSISDKTDWDIVSNLTKKFWKSSTAAQYMLAPANYTLGFKNASLFQGCVWIGMTNMQALSATTSDNVNSMDSIAFIDGTPMANFITNIRNPTPVSVSGWSMYGANDKYATCGMLCPSPNPTQVALGYTDIVLAECSSVVLPFVCKFPAPPAVVVPDVVAEAAATPAPTPAAPTPTPSAHGRRSLRNSAPEASATETVAVVESTHSSWPIVPELIPTILGINASCSPMGAWSYCTFPSYVALTQSDWNYVCWQAGLEPLSIDSYSEMTVMMTSRVPSNVSYVFSQTSTGLPNAEFANMYKEADFLVGWQTTSNDAANDFPNVQYSGSLLTATAPITLPPFSAVGKPTQAPAYAYLGTANGVAAANNLPCGPTGYGFGCAAAMAYTAGAPSGLTTIGAGTKQSGMCKKPYVDTAMPRPDTAAIPQVEFLFQFTLPSDAAVEAIVMELDASNAFVEMLSKVAVPAALPGVAPGDVIPPRNGAIAKFYPASENDTTGVLGAYTVITLPYTVNTTASITAYMQNLVSNTMMVIPASFIAQYEIQSAIGSIAGISGNTDVDTSTKDHTVAIAVGLGIGFGVPVIGLIAFAVYKFAGSSKGKEIDD